MIAEFKKGMSHIINVLKSLGFEYITHSDRLHEYDVEFEDENGYTFAIIFILSPYNKTFRIKASLANYNEIMDIIKDQFLNIKGLRYKGDTDTFFIKDVDDVIKNFTKKEIEIRQNVNKFNI